MAIIVITRKSIIYINLSCSVLTSIDVPFCSSRLCAFARNKKRYHRTNQTEINGFFQEFYGLSCGIGLTLWGNSFRMRVAQASGDCCANLPTLPLDFPPDFFERTNFFVPFYERFSNMSPLFAVPLTPTTLIVIAAIAFLLFGNRLPSVMRSLGRSVTEFKKGVAGIEDDINDAVAKAEKQTEPSEKHE